MTLSGRETESKCVRMCVSSHSSFQGYLKISGRNGVKFQIVITKDYNYVKAYIMTLINKLRPFSVSVSVCVCGCHTWGGSIVNINLILMLILY